MGGTCSGRKSGPSDAAVIHTKFPRKETRAGTQAGDLG